MELGQVVGDRFTLETLAGSGGMGAVYRAHDRLSGKKVALKVVLDGEWDDRFVREARVLAEIAADGTAPGIVRYVAHGLSLSGELYLAMEWLEGQDLAARLAHAPLTVEESVRVIARAAAALAPAHARGVIHRDLKPSNLFLHEGEIDGVKVVDFGLARGGASTRVPTRTGSLLGTPGYMAPEQARGEPGVDARADVFSLGCVLFECLTGRPPFVGEHVTAVLAKILLAEAPRLHTLRADLPPDLDDLVARMLAKDPSTRPSDAGSVARELAALGAIAGGRPFTETPPPTSITRGAQRLLFVVLAGTLDYESGLEGSTLKEGDFFSPCGPSGDDEPTLDERGHERGDAGDDGAGDEGGPRSGIDAVSIANIRSLVGAHGGRVEPFASGSIVATFAGSGAATDQAAHAARAALALRAVLPEMPMALASGLGEVSASGTLGALIDRAARLLGEHPESAHGGVRLDEATAGLLDVHFDVGGDARGLTLCGEHELVSSTRTLLGRPSLFVGRDRELSSLESVFDECVSEPVARAVLVTADAGAGKSRLRFELVERLQARSDSPEVWLGRSDPLSAGSPFALISPAIRRAIGVREGEPLTVRRQKVRARIARLVPSADVQRVSEFLGELIGTAFGDEAQSPAGDGGENASVQLRAARKDPMLMGDQMRRAFVDWIGAECAVRPVLLVLEDLQWGDLPSVKFVDHVLRSLPDAPLMVLALARPNVHDVFPRLWAARAVTEIRLRDLPRRACERLVRETLGADLRDYDVDRIVTQAAGNAFYLEELIRAVAEGKGDLHPTTVLAMVQARLEDLDGETRRVLRAASVFGQSCWASGVASLLGDDVPLDRVRARLAELGEREVVTRRSESKFAGIDEHRFRNALVREAAYAMLTEKDRVTGHVLAGRWLESVGESDAMVLAEHAERGYEPWRAIRWYLRAAEQALEGNDLAAAIARAQSGIGHGADGEVLGLLRAVQGEAHKWRGEMADAEALGLEALRFLPVGSDSWCRAAGEVIVTSGRRGNTEPLADILEVLGRLAASAASAPDSLRGGGDEASAEYVVLAVRAAIRLLDDGRYDRAVELIDLIDSLARPFLGEGGDPVVAARVSDAHATRALCDGDPGEYLRRIYEVVDLFEAAGDLRTACLQRGNAGYAYAQVGAWTEAERVLSEALAMAERMGLTHIAAMVRSNLAPVLAYRGALVEARAAVEDAIGSFAAQGGRRMEGASRAYLATILAMGGDLDGAEREALAAVETLQAIAPIRAQALARLAHVRLLQGRPGEAVEASTDALRIVEALGGVEDGESLVRLMHAVSLSMVGRSEAAQVAIVYARRRLLERAARIADPIWRDSFLSRVPENARTIELAAQWGADTAVGAGKGRLPRC